MKHIVNLVVSQPGHEFVSMRSRTQQKTYMQEARSVDEAINRATRHFRTLGFKVHTATIQEQKAPVTAPTAAPVQQSLTEGVADIEAAKAKREAAMKKATAEVDKSDVSQRAGKAQAGSALAAYLKKKAETMKEEVESTEVQYIEEKLTAADPASKWIKDFVDSDNPKFEGKSKKERINQALGAYYAAKRALEEEVELDEKVSGEAIAGPKGYTLEKKPNKKGLDDDVTDYHAIRHDKTGKVVGSVYKRNGQKDWHYDDVGYGGSGVRSKEHAATFVAWKHHDEYGNSNRRLAKEEVDQIDEANARHSFDAAQQALTPKSSDVKTMSGTTNRDKAKASKYIRRMSKLSGWTKDEVAANFADLKKEEAEQVMEMDKSQTHPGRGEELEGLPLGAKGTPIKSEKAKKDALKAFTTAFGKSYTKKIKEEAEQVEEGRAMDYKMSRSGVAGDRGDSKGGDINVPQSQKDEIAKIFAKKDDKKEVKEAAEGTTPTTTKEKELAAKAGDPNKITKKDVLAARGVKLDEVKGSYKDIATEKAEDERLANKKEAKDTKSAKAAETIVNLAKSKKNKVNLDPKIDHSKG